MTSLIAIAALVVVVFVAIWMLLVVPAEKRHHQRKLDALQRRIEIREAEAARMKYTAPEQGKPDNESGQRGPER